MQYATLTLFFCALPCRAFSPSSEFGGAQAISMALGTQNKVHAKKLGLGPGQARAPQSHANVRTFRPSQAQTSLVKILRDLLSYSGNKFPMFKIVFLWWEYILLNVETIIPRVQKIFMAGLRIFSPLQECFPMLGVYYSAS